jgi:hypothetical protein
MVVEVRQGALMDRPDGDGPRRGGNGASRRPILGVDVDGVLNLLEDRHDPRAVRAELWTTPTGWLIPIPVGTGERLARLSDAFEMVWATAWGTNAYPALKDILALERPWPVIDLWSEYVPDVAETWKLPAVERWLEEQDASDGWYPWPGAPFAWLDDDLEDDAMAWADERALWTPTLLIRVDPATGLTDEHVERLVAWAAGLARA